MSIPQPNMIITARGRQDGQDAFVVPSPCHQEAEVAEHQPAGPDVDGASSHGPYSQAAGQDDEQGDPGKFVPAPQRRQSAHYQQRHGVGQDVAESPVQEGGEQDAPQSFRLARQYAVGVQPVSHHQRVHGFDDPQRRRERDQQRQVSHHGLPPGFRSSRKNSRLPLSPRIGEAQRSRTRSPSSTAQAMTRPSTAAWMAGSFNHAAPSHLALAGLELGLDQGQDA